MVMILVILAAITYKGVKIENAYVNPINDDKFLLGVHALEKLIENTRPNLWSYDTPQFRHCSCDEYPYSYAIYQ